MNSIVIVLTVLLIIALVLFALWFAGRKKLAATKKKIQNGKFPSDEEELREYERVISRLPELRLRSEAVRLLFDYCRRKHAGRMEIIEKALIYGEMIRKDFSNMEFYEDSMFELGNIYFFEKYDFEKALEIFSELMKKKPYSRWKAVCDIRTRLIEINISSEEALKLYVTAEKYFENSRFADAEAYLHNIIKDYPGSDLAGTSLFFLGDIYYYKHNDTKKALSCYRQLYKEFSGHRSSEKAIYKAGEILRKKEQWDKAIKLYREFSKKFPESSYRDDAYFYIGECYQNMDRPRDAKNAYSLILGDYPDSKWTDVIYHRVQELNKRIEDE